MNKTLKALGLTAIMAFSAVMPLGLNLDSAKAVHRSDYLGNRILRDSDWRDRRFFDDDHRVRLRIDRRFDRRSDFLFHRPISLRLRDGIFSPRTVIIRDRDGFFRNDIVLTNRLTGPFSRNVNRVVFDVDRDSFLRLANDIRISNEIDIDADTGGNDISFNTRVGSVRSGDIDISID